MCKNDIVQTGFIDESKIRIIYHGIDEEKFNNKPLTNIEINYYNQFNISSPFVLFVSVIYPYKNVHVCDFFIFNVFLI